MYVRSSVIAAALSVGVGGPLCLLLLPGKEHSALLPLPGEERCAAPTDLVVHEWGTFTSMQGSDGMALEGLQHEEESLPAFVYSRSKVRECPLRDRGYKGLECEVEHVTRKMETPVIYFYSGRAHHERVRVCFNRGLLTQWFPVTDLLGPPEHDRRDGPLDMSKVDKSFLEWDVDVLPPGQAADTIPSVKAGEPWSFQRLPDSNVVRTLPRTLPRVGPVETEKFLFYRGLGTFDLPITARVQADGKLALSNSGTEDLRGLFVIQVKNGRGAFSAAPLVPAGTGAVVVPLPMSSAAPAIDTPSVDAPSIDTPSIDAMVETIIPALEAKLVAAGLYPKEAEAMARTWERSYFRSEGLRVLYVVPERLTNAILPLAIEPAPKSIVRVLVGRLECITPAVEAEVQQALRDRGSENEAVRRAAGERLERLGRFLEPHLRRVIASTQDERVRASAKEFLAGL
jgi:hypothetical protein